MFTLKQLRHAMALERHGSFHGAAKAENLSQPALSRSIRALEEQLGVRLFDRQGASVVPTLFGTAVLQRAATALGETGELVREVQLLKGLEAGDLQIAMGVYAAEMSASRAVGELIDRHPGLNCRLKLTSWKDLGALITSRTVDLGIGEISTLEDARELAVEPVGRHRVILFCRRKHPLAGRNRLSTDDLSHYPTVTPRLPPRATGLFPGKTRPDRDTGDLLPSIEVDDLASARMVVANSDAFGFATPLQIEPWLRSGEFRVMPFDAPWLELNYGFIYLRDRMLSPAAEAYMQLVRRIEQEVRGRNQALMQELADGLGRD
jgi:DNA-binding transcriptional LysR family regulator